MAVSPATDEDDPGLPGLLHSLQLLRLRAILSAMAAGVEVRPGSIEAGELDALDRTLGPARPAHVGETPRLVGPDGQGIELPEEIFDVLAAVVDQLKAGNGISVVPMHAELTTVEAADLLNVSRPFLITQLERGVLPYRMVGTHRRVRLSDVLTYRDAIDRQAGNALDAMTTEAEALGLYDD